ncbi:MAG: hypothetical protein LBV07_02380 [Syntrophobacterales bacterium]|jgi:methyl-accepting chemotaxis protein|nr:hypothetical protein [Syntrophobacterales bacterium]
MMRHSLRSKIIFPTVVILTLLVTAMTIFSSVIFVNFYKGFFEERIVVTAGWLKNYLHDCERISKAAAVSVSKDPEVVKAVKGRDTKEIIRVLTPTLELYGIGFYTVTDNAGIVLARTHVDRVGDSVSNQQNIEDALAGKVSTYC